MPLHVLIVGAGITGLATAIGFARHGHHVTVLERKPRHAEKSGSGILLGPNAMRVIEAWGLKDTFEPVAHVNGVMNLRRFDTGLVVKNLRKPKGSLMNWYVRRVDAWGILYEHAAKNGVEVRFGMAVIGVVDSLRPAVLLEDGSSMESDLIVGADGIHSRIRHSLFPQAPPTAQRECTFQILIPQSAMEKHPLTKALYDDPSIQIWLGPGCHSIACAVPKRHEYDMQLTDHEYGFEPDGSVGTWHGRITNLHWLRSRFKEFNPAVRLVLAEATSCWKWRLAESATLPSWTSGSGRVVLLGDSCHAMVPFAGQGAAQCIEDAAVLSELLSRTSSIEQIPRLTKMYEQLRRPRVGRVRAYARANGENYTLPDGAEQKRRDEILRTSARKVVEKGGKAPFGDAELAKWLDNYDAIQELVSGAEELKHDELGGPTTRRCE